MNTYLSEFLQYRCAGDVLNAVAPLHRAAKEITEAMAAVRRLKPFFLDAPMERNLVDLCAGNALASILAVHLLPVKAAVALDKSPRNRPGYRAVRRWSYVAGDIADGLSGVSTDPCAIVAVHACGNLASRIIELYLQTPWARLLVLSPCCHGEQNPQRRIPAAFRSRITKYEAWVWWLAEGADGTLYIDPHVLSPCNAVIVARKGEGS